MTEAQYNKIKKAIDLVRLLMIHLEQLVEEQKKTNEILTGVEQIKIGSTGEPKTQSEK